MAVEKLTTTLLHILEELEAHEQQINDLTRAVHPQYVKSAKNLLRYLLLRTHDLREFHDQLSDLGIAAVRTSESYVYSSIFSVTKNLHLVQGLPFDRQAQAELFGYQASKQFVNEHANELFNESTQEHHTEIMVTLPLEAADDPDIIREMVICGMEIARINLSHGDLAIWSKMVDIIRTVEEELDREVKIYMDLSGPKIRTSEIEVIKQRKKKKKKKGPKVNSFIRVREGEHLMLTKRPTRGKASTFGDLGEQIEIGEIGVQLPQIIDDLKLHDRVMFDDGMIHAIVIDKIDDSVELVINGAYKSKIGSRKGINLPDTVLNLPALTETDIENLPFVVAHADMVGYSFVRTPNDVAILYQQIKEHGGEHLGVVFKIENQEAVENLPKILLEGMKHSKVGVMIARGDLAVEIGFDRISEVQTQILQICEAAHIPVIWATQVLENLAKTGIPTRAEISDAAFGTFADCVMLNKGPYINEAIKTLQKILYKTESRTSRKKGALPSLPLAEETLGDLFE